MVFPVRVFTKICILSTHCGILVSYIAIFQQILDEVKKINWKCFNSNLKAPMYMMHVFDHNNNCRKSSIYYKQFSESLSDLFLATAKAPLNLKSHCGTFPLSKKKKKLILLDTDLGNFIFYPSCHLGLTTFYLVFTLIISLNLQSTTKLWSQLPFQMCGYIQGRIMSVSLQWSCWIKWLVCLPSSNATQHANLSLVFS